MTKHWLTVIAVIFVAQTVSIHAEEVTSKDWKWNVTGDEYYYAATTNQAGLVVGQYCYFESENCLYAVGLDVTCESSIPALVNSDQGSLSIELVCGDEVEDQNIMMVTPFDDFDNVIRTAKNIGIAVPMEEGKFKVSRFSLFGSTYAIDIMRAAAEIEIEKREQSQKKNVDVEYL